MMAGLTDGALEIDTTDHALFFRRLVEDFFGFGLEPGLERRFASWLEGHEDGFDRLIAILTASTAGSAFSRIFFVPVEYLFAHFLVERRVWEGIHSRTVLGEASGGLGIAERVRRDLDAIIAAREGAPRRGEPVFSCPFVRVSRLAAEQKAVELEAIFREVKALSCEERLGEFMKSLLLWWMCKQYQDGMLGDLSLYADRPG